MVYIFGYNCEVIIRNTDINNNFSRYCSFGGDSNVSIINSNIGESVNEKTNIFVGSYVNIDIISYKLKGQKTKCESKTINIDNNSLLEGKEKNILTKEDDCKVNINVAKSELDIKRKQVVEVLRKIRNNCIKRNEETIIKCQKQLNAKIIRKLLRNK